MNFFSIWNAASVHRVGKRKPKKKGHSHMLWPVYFYIYLLRHNFFFRLQLIYPASGGYCQLQRTLQGKSSLKTCFLYIFYVMRFTALAFSSFNPTNQRDISTICEFCWTNCVRFLTLCEPQHCFLAIFFLLDTKCKQIWELFWSCDKGRSSCVNELYVTIS